jgi:hypothetical protein
MFPDVVRVSNLNYERFVQPFVQADPVPNLPGFHEPDFIGIPSARKLHYKQNTVYKTP